MRRRHIVRFKRFFRDHVLPVALTVLVLCSFRSAIADWNIVPSGSMNPTIVEGDRIFVNKLAYDLKVPFTTRKVASWSDPQRGEIVVFNSPRDGTRLVKRCVGVGGDVVSMIDDQLFINGHPASYSDPRVSGGNLLMTEQFDGAGSHGVQAIPRIRAMRNFGPVTVPAGSFYMLGDNRDNSADSRYFGFVPRDLIVGRSSAVVASFDPDTHLPRLNRMCKSLP